jgi:hypothetical protein
MLVANLHATNNLSSKRSNVKIVAHRITKDSRPQPRGKQRTVHALLVSHVKAVQMVASAADNANEIHLTSIIHSLNTAYSLMVGDQ